MKVLVVGSGGREHALVWKISQSKKVDKIYCAPGNAGISQLAECINIKAENIAELKKFAIERKIDLTIIGPEIPLVAGIVDEFKKDNLKVFGPTKAAAKLEGSKIFAKEMMKEFNVPTAVFAEFSNEKDAIEYLQTSNIPVVIKADGLAAGKGVIVAGDFEEAEEAIHRMLVEKEFGEASSRIIIEECLTGREVSLLAFSDGKTVIPMVPACDYKRVFDGDAGPNTGGMGSYSPPGFFNKGMVKQVTDTIIKPVVAAMEAQGSPYRGVLYTGLILTGQGPKVLEFNARFGDPETQAILPRLKTDLVDIMLATVNGTLDKIKIEWSGDACAGVVLASGGYPGEYQTGQVISISDNLEQDVNIFYAGAKKHADGRIVTDGGRVLTVTATGKTMKAARDKAYRNIKYVNFEGMHYRTDIAEREVN